MAPQRIFLDLPGEVRRAIYDAYFIEDGGYVYNFKTRKLEARDRNGAKQPIDHALRLTCKQVAHETHGLALNVNIIHFAADYSDEMRVKAACTHFSLYSRVWTPAEVLRGRDDEDEDDDNEEDDDDDQHQQAQQGQQDQQGQLDEPPIPYVEEDESDTVLCGFTEAILEEAIQEFPRAESFLRAVLSNDRTVVPKRERNDWGPPRSYIHRTILRVYELALKYNTFPQHWYPADPNVHFYHKDHEHWAPARLLPYLKKYPTWCYIPPGPKNEELRPFIYSIKQTEEHWERPRYRDLDGHTQYTEGKYRFSAAAAAIKFLSQFPIHFRRHLRRIHLNEHSISVSMPETHGHGLIEYCQENRHLRIERRADMWRTVFQTPCTNREMGGAQHELNWEEQSRLPERERGRPSWKLTHSLAMWIMEVLELRMAGMPEQSFKLILDAGPAHEQCTDIFQNIIQRTAIWQQVATRINEGTDPRFRRHWYTEKQDNGCFVLDGFPEAVQDLVNGHCRSIETTFNIGPMLWDVDTEFRKYSYMDGLQFAEFTLSKAEHIEPVSPFPRFLDLLAEHILPQYWEEREYKTVPVYEYEDLELDWISPSNHDDVNANNGEPANEQHTLDNGSATSYASNSASSEDGVQTDNSPSSHPNEEMAREVDAGSDDLADGNVLHEKEEATGDDVDKELSPSLPDMVQQMTLGGPIEGPVPTNQPGNTV